jgi:hypothetical protein
MADRARRLALRRVRAKRLVHPVAQLIEQRPSAGLADGAAKLS